MAIYKFSDMQNESFSFDSIALDSVSFQAHSHPDQLELFPLDEIPLKNPAKKEVPEKTRDKILSACMARLFFLVLFCADIFWIAYSVMRFVLFSLLHPVFLCKSEYVRKKLFKSTLSLKRSLVCALSLFIALFCPGFGILVGCAYFLMYDREGIEEVVPISLREQFQDFFQLNIQ